MGQMNYDVSLVVPCFNSERYVEKCIRSIVAQLDLRIEIIAIDDCSTDKTLSVLRALESEFEDLVVIALDENGGQASARNLGIDTARGEFIAFLDSDDWYINEGTLAEWVACARAGEAELCTSNFARFRRDQSFKVIDQPELPGDSTFNIASRPQLAYISQCWQILYRRDFLNGHGLRFSSELRQREDRLFFISCLLKAGRVSHNDRVTIAYRAHDASTMANPNLDQLHQYCRHLEILADAINENLARKHEIADFLTLNSARYFTSVVSYWSATIATLIETVDECYSLDPVLKGLFSSLLAISNSSGPLFRGEIADNVNLDRLREGDYDIIRIAIELNDDDALANLIMGKRLHISRILPWIDKSKFDWASAAIAHYLRFQRAHRFPEDSPTAQTPALSELVNKIILHIGMPKTGSSSIQDFLEVNRPALLEQGILYPALGIERGKGVRANRTGGHATLLKWHLDGNAQIGPALSQHVISLGKPVRVLILSIENIFSDRFLKLDESHSSTIPSIVESIVSSLSEANVEIWTTLRRQDEWFESYYREIMANPFNNLVCSPEDLWNKLFDFGVFNYSNIIRRIKSLQNVSSVRIGSFEQVNQTGGSVAWLIDGIGIDLANTSIAQPPRSNNSYTDAMANAIMILKKIPLSTKARSDAFVRIIGNETLQKSGSRLIASDDWRRFDAKIANELAEFDRDFPREKKVQRGEVVDNASLAFDSDLLRLFLEIKPDETVSESQLATVSRKLAVSKRQLATVSRKLADAGSMNVKLSRDFELRKASFRARLDKMTKLIDLTKLIDRENQRYQELRAEMGLVKNRSQRMNWRFLAKKVSAIKKRSLQKWKRFGLRNREM